MILTHNPSTIDQNQDLLVRFPNLGNDDVIIPGTANLSFNIELTSTADPNRTIVSNISRAIIKELAVKFEGNEILSMEVENGLRKEKCCKTRQHQGMKLRIDAGDKSAGVTRDKAIADAYSDKFIIPLDFEMLDSAMPYYQA